MTIRTWVASLILLALTPLLVVAEDPAKKTSLDLLPPSVVAYVEVPAAGRLVDTLLDHPLTKQLEQTPDYQRALESPDVQHLQAELKRLEAKIGAEWRPALRSIVAEGVYVGVELGTQGVIVLVRSSDPQLLEKTRQALLDLAKEEGRELATADYRGVPTHHYENAYYATVGPWLVITNKSRLGQMVVDNALEADRPGLGSERLFQQAHKLKPEGVTAWAYVDLTILRLTGIAKAALHKKGDNPLAEMLVGGIMAAVPEAPFVTASLTIEPERIGFSTAIPYDPQTIGPERAYYFGPEGKGASPALLSPQQTLFSLSTYRDFSLMWKRAPDLFDDNTNGKFAEAESGLATLFSGRSFPDDILGSLEPGLQWVIARQSFGKDDVAPEIKLPATAIVVRMKKPEDTARQFKITFQSVVGFLNVAGAMNGFEALEQDTERIGGVTLVSATYLPPEEKAAAGIHHNASPTVAFVGDRFILSSTKKLALELAQAFEKGALPDDAGVNTQLRISGEVLRATLADNRPQLVAQNQEEKGHTVADAEQEIDLLMKILGGLREMSLRLVTKEDALSLTWELKLSAGK